MTAIEEGRTHQYIGPFHQLKYIYKKQTKKKNRNKTAALQCKLFSIK